MGTFISNSGISVTKINKNFVIRHRAHGEESKQDKLIGAGRFVETYGTHYADKFFDKAWNSPNRKEVFKIRGKHVITFATK